MARAIADVIRVENLTFARKPVFLTLQTFNPEDESEPMGFDTGTHREFEFLKEDSLTGVRTVGTNEGVTYSPELTLFENKEFASGSAPTLAGVQHLKLDWSSNDAGAKAFWTEGSAILCRCKTGAIGGVDVAKRPFLRLNIGPEFAPLTLMPGIKLQTTTAAVTGDPKVFTLSGGPASNNVLNGLRLRIVPQDGTPVITDTVINGYVGSTKQVTVEDTPGSNVAGDFVTVYTEDAGPILIPTLSLYNAEDNSSDKYVVHVHQDCDLVPSGTSGLSVKLLAAKQKTATVIIDDAGSPGNGEAMSNGELGSFEYIATAGAERVAIGDIVVATVKITYHGVTRTFGRTIKKG